MDKDPIINCHTHIFTADHVPPFLARTFVPFPFHVLISLRLIVTFFRWWYKGPATIPYTVWYKKLVRTHTAITAFFTRLFPLNIIGGYYIFLFAFFMLFGLLLPVFPPEQTWVSKMIYKAYVFLHPVFPDIRSAALKIFLIAIVFMFVESIRNLILFFSRLLWKFLSKIPGKQTKEMFRRYLNIGRYAFHQEQKTILSKLKSQYPQNTGFIVLPMDMDYMGAGTSKTRYRDQMQSLAEVKEMPSNKEILFPFVFADPRRIVKPEKEKRYRAGDKEYFDWFIEGGKIKLTDCFIREYIEERRFSGIKIYPALGYYPFDERLLPLWKYAADNNIPVLTHCIRGTIFYRGIKKQEWNQHPVFQQAMQSRKVNEDAYGFKDDEQLEKDGITQYVPLVLAQIKNMDFSVNFTHPLNYLCLLEEELLRRLITNAISRNENSKLKELFGYNGPDKPLTNDLQNLKICFGHFGGEDEWKRFFEKDRYSFSSQLVKNPNLGIEFLKTINGKPSQGKPEQLWKHTDWYSIICSMMLQYPNVYADISYILHGDQEILPLLKQTLQNPGLKEKVLYGTDFFVVRNHKSDKNMLADMTGGLSEAQFDQIARINPRTYLQNSLSV